MTLVLLEELRQRTYDLSSLVAVISSGQRSPAAIWPEIRRHFGPVELTTATE